MDLRILNTNLEAIAIVDAYESFIWSDRYYEYGDFELYMAMDSTLLDFLRKDYYIQIRESDHLMIIEDLKIESDAEEGNRLWKPSWIEGSFGGRKPSAEAFKML